MADLRKIRYAVVGLGHIAQTAVLPAFKNARTNSQLTALISGDSVKLKELSSKYRGAKCFTYDQYDDCLRSGEVDAVYIALPNDLHKEYTVRAAAARVHVLCEKPLAESAEACQEMISACAQAGVKLMTAYRLHYDLATIDAIEVVRSGKIGDPRFFSSTFSMQVEDTGNIRLDRERAGGPAFDLGVYCINAARYLFDAEPIEAAGFHAKGADGRFDEVPEMTSALLRFPGERLAQFTCSFGAADTSACRVVGTKGDLCLEPAYDYAEPLEHRLTIDGKQHRKKYRKGDQFGPELLEFSQCVLDGREPEPDGQEGLADVRVIEAIYQSAAEGRSIQLEPFSKARRPRIGQAIRKRAVAAPEEVHAASPHEET
jgi:glucose-fructose oxidoreductase